MHSHTTFWVSNLLALIAILNSKLPKRNYKFSVLGYCFLLFHWSCYSGSLAECPSLKLFLIVSTLFSFLNHSIWSFLTQIMPIFLGLAGLVTTQKFWAIIGSGNFEQPTLVDKLTWLWAGFRFVFFIKVVVLCHSFLMV